MDIKFIDLFAGIGGFRMSFDKCGCQCVFSSEFNDACQKVYEMNYGDKHKEILLKLMKNQFLILIYCVQFYNYDFVENLYNSQLVANQYSNFLK